MPRTVGQPSKATDNVAKKIAKSKNGKKSSQPAEPRTRTLSTKTPKNATSKGKGKKKGKNRKRKRNTGEPNKDRNNKSFSSS